MPFLRNQRAVGPAARRLLGITTCAAILCGSGAQASAAIVAQAPSASARAHPPGQPGRMVLLLNGDQVAAVPGPDGQTTSLLRPVADAGTVIGLALGTNRYYIPAAALPFLGRGLALSLFSLADLRRQESGGRLPVQLSYPGRRPTIPGLTITWAGRHSALGYLTASSAQVFGAALARQVNADHATASYGRDGLFAGGASITLAGTPAVPARSARHRARPNSQMRTLAVAGTDLAGRPDTGDAVFVFNAADWREFGDPIESESIFYHGTAKFSVPAGTYWAFGLFGSGRFPRMIVLPQFTVSASTTVHLTARSAVKVTMVTPRPAVQDASSVLVVRGGQHGTSQAIFVIGAPAAWVSPTTRKPTVGTLRTYTVGYLASPARAKGQPYDYQLALASAPGLITAGRWVIGQDSLATEHDRYYQDRPDSGWVFVYGGSLTQWRYFVTSGAMEFRLPGTLTNYYSAGPSDLWTGGYVSSNVAQTGGQQGWLTGRPGKQLTSDWGQYPQHPQPNAQVLTGAAGHAFPAEPSAFRVGSRLHLIISPFSDNQAGHLAPPAGFVRGRTGQYALYQDGVRIAHGATFTPSAPGGKGGIAGLQGISARLRSRPSNIKLVVTAARSAALFRLSSSSTTVWTWRSQRRPGARVPSTWYCRSSYPSPMQRTCAVQPMMTLDYQVGGLGLDGRTSPGRQFIGLDAGHIQIGGHARITGASVHVSADGGKTWRHATVRAAGAGRFTVTFMAHAHTEICLRVAATDAVGGSITETIRDAYGVRS